eukprot:PITA_01109
MLFMASGERQSLVSAAESPSSNTKEETEAHNIPPCFSVNSSVAEFSWRTKWVIKSSQMITFPLHSAYRKISPLHTARGRFSNWKPMQLLHGFTGKNDYDQIIDNGKRQLNMLQHDLQLLGILRLPCLIFAPAPSFSYTEKLPAATSFLDFCYLCKRSIEQGSDIFIYRGDRAFCSLECRYDHIVVEELMMSDITSSSPRTSPFFTSLSCDDIYCEKSYSCLPRSTSTTCM